MGHEHLGPVSWLRFFDPRALTGLSLAALADWERGLLIPELCLGLVFPAKPLGDLLLGLEPAALAGPELLLGLIHAAVGPHAQVRFIHSKAESLCCGRALYRTASRIGLTWTSANIGEKNLPLGEAQAATANCMRHSSPTSKPASPLPRFLIRHHRRRHCKLALQPSALNADAIDRIVSMIQ